MTEKTSLLNFPCRFPLKVFGAAIPELEAAVIKILQKHVSSFEPSALEIRPSKGGRYYAVTAMITAESKEQLDAVYQELSSHELIIMTL